MLVIATAIAHDAHAQANRPAPERLGDPPGVAAKPLLGARPTGPIAFGHFSSFQVNVDGNGANIPGDAANEPSIAVDPTNPNRIAIGWRQFDTVLSNFRQAGYAYSTDAGATWTFPGKLTPGVFRSDPVLDFDAEGNFYYSSLRQTFDADVFRSVDGGATWGSPVFSYGGDKQWITIDRTTGAGHGNIYQAWSTAGNNYAPNQFNRSIDDGASFQAPIPLPNEPIWGTLDVAPNGTLYVVGVGDYTADDFWVLRSTNAKFTSITPTFAAAHVSLGGPLGFSGGPNPAGLTGQTWIAVDRSSGPTAGYIYVMASVQVLGDPLDVRFVRSIDGGVSWSTPVRVNDDAPGNWQWFATMSVASSGRIDAVWNDTRHTGLVNSSELFYSYSTDGGVTWSVNEQASPVWDSFVGWPNQQKIGDYYDMISDDTGAHLAWAATFNGEQDVYYTRIGGSATAVADRTTPGYSLLASAPNPFNPSTTIRFEVPSQGGRITLAVYDVNGRLVRSLQDGFVAGGTGTAQWDGRDASGREVASGVYFCRLSAAGVSQTRKLMLLR
jgi:hypothetical protein